MSPTQIPLKHTGRSLLGNPPLILTVKVSPTRFPVIYTVWSFWVPLLEGFKGFTDSMPPMGSLTVHGFNGWVHIYILPIHSETLTSLKTPVNPTILTHSSTIFHPFPPFSCGLTATPAQDCFLIPPPKRHAKFHPLFACCVISKPMHACPLTLTAYTSSLVFRPLHFDVTPSAECVLTAIPTHSSVLYVLRQLVHPMHPHPSLVLFFCKYHWSIFQGPNE